MNARTFPALVAAAVAVLAAPAAAQAATPSYCRTAGLERILVERGKLEKEFKENFRGANGLRCRDFTGDGVKDVLFGVASGGTAGNTKWGIILGRPGGRAGRLAKYVTSYKAGTSFTGRDPEVSTPDYAEGDGNCCPSAFFITRWHWNGAKFVKVRTTRTTTLPRRFTT